MKRVVVDASVILKWVLPSHHETYQKQALDLRDAFGEEKVQLLVPTLWYFEVGNLLARKFPAQAATLLSSLSALLAPTEQSVSPRMQADILRLTAGYGVTFYDAAYHALALVGNAVLLTADEKYLRAVGSEPGAVHISQWISNQ